METLCQNLAQIKVCCTTIRNFSTPANTTHGFSSLKTKDGCLVSRPHMTNAEKNLFREVSTAGVLLVIFSSAGSLWTRCHPWKWLSSSISFLGRGSNQLLGVCLHCMQTKFNVETYSFPIPKAPGVSSCLTSGILWTDREMDSRWVGLTRSSYLIESPNTIAWRWEGALNVYVTLG